MTTSEVLNKAADLIETRGWCKGVYSLNEHGGPADPWDDDACLFCMVGAIKRVVGVDGNDFPIWKHLYKQLGMKPSVFNDFGTKEEVIQALRDAAKETA